MLDRNIRNVFTALEKHKLYVEDKFSQIEVTQERLKSTVQQLETDHTISNVTQKGGKAPGGKQPATLPAGNNAQA